MIERPWIQHYDEGTSADIDFEAVPLGDLLRANARARPDHPAVIFFGRRISYAELDDIVDRFAAALQAAAVGRGDRVMISMPNCPQAVMAYQAIWRIGAVAVPSNPLYTAWELAHQAEDSGAKAIVVLSMRYPVVQEARPGTTLQHIFVTNIKEYFSGATRALFTLLRERKGGHRVELGDEPGAVWLQDALAAAPRLQPVDVDPGDTAMLMYTGGTTGVPKGAELTHQNLLANAHQMAEFATDLAPTGEVMLTALPLTHSYSVTVSMTLSMMRGYTQVVVPDPRDLKSLLSVIHEHRPTVFPGVPTLYQALGRHRLVATGKYDLSSIRFCISGAAALAPEIKESFEAVTGAKIIEGYGLSEASPVTHANPLGSSGQAGSIGVPLPSTLAKVVDEESETRVLPPGERGVLCVSGPQVMRGYWNMPEETAATLRSDEDGRVWLHTGDVVVMDETGLFRIVDRKKDMILAAGGFNVYPREVEDVLYEHPAVVEAAVIGVPVGGKDQRVKAFVVTEPDKAVGADELIEFCREHLARFKVPRFVEFRDDLPKTFVGKVLRRKLAEEEAASAEE
jgi:long-chain acyl-CoA synthetase